LVRWDEPDFWNFFCSSRFGLRIFTDRIPAGWTRRIFLFFGFTRTILPHSKGFLHFFKESLAIPKIVIGQTAMIFPVLSLWNVLVRFHRGDRLLASKDLLIHLFFAQWWSGRVTAATDWRISFVTVERARTVRGCVLQQKITGSIYLGKWGICVVMKSTGSRPKALCRSSE